MVSGSRERDRLSRPFACADKGPEFTTRWFWTDRKEGHEN